MVRPRSRPGGHPDPVELVLRHAPVGEVAEHRRAPLGRPDQAQVGGPGRDGLLDGLLVAVALGGHHHHRALVRVGRRERPAVHAPWLRQPSARARSASVVDHRRAAHDDQVRRGQHRLDVDLQRALALAGDRAPRSSRPARAAPNCSGVPSSSSRGTPSAITCWASRITTGSAHAPPIQPCRSPAAVMIAREPCWPEDGPCRQTTVASANGWPRRVSSPASSSTSQLCISSCPPSAPASSLSPDRGRAGDVVALGDRLPDPVRAAAACRCCAPRSRTARRAPR